MVVTYVSPRSPAADLRGFGPGIIIAAVGTRNVEGVKDFQAEVKKANGRPLLLLLRNPRGAGQTTVAVPPR